MGYLGAFYKQFKVYSIKYEHYFVLHCLPGSFAHIYRITRTLCTQFCCCDYSISLWWLTVYLKKYAHGFCFAVLCCGYTLTDFPISIRLTSLALWQSNDCPSASKATLMNMDKYFMWIHYKRLHNHNKAKHNKTVCIFLGIYCSYSAIILFRVASVDIFIYPSPIQSLLNLVD